MEFKKLYLVVIGILIMGSISAKDVAKPISAIPDSLCKNANSVVLDYVVECELTAPYTSFRCNFKKTYAILSKHGDNDANITIYTDKFTSLKRFSGKLYNASGELIRKIKQSDLHTTEYSSGLASDSERHSYGCDHRGYPYTIEYEWSIEEGVGTLYFPIFIPITRYDQALQKASYKITLPESMGYNYKSANVAEPSIITNEAKISTVEWTTGAMCAVESETYFPDFKELVPVVYAEPKQFKYGEYIGNQNRWEEISAWTYTLLEGRNDISDELISTIRQMTDTIATTRDKVKCVYEYLDKTTRYVSIQLGIGGYQPIKSSEVEKTGFGDCKALSLYTQALLGAIGIESNYIVISTDNERLYPDYPSTGQMNHAILQVPLEDETLWLECTNPSYPFGYIYSTIAGHDALPATREGSGLVRLPSYADSLNLECYNVAITLNEDASAEGTVVRKSHIVQYEYLVGIKDMDKSEQINFLRKRLSFNSASISNVSVEEDKSSLPSVTVSYDFTAKFRTIGKDIIRIRINPFRSMSSTSKTEKRKHKIVVRYGFCDIDTIRIAIPKGYALDSSPEIDSMQTKFGSFRSQVAVEGGDIIITQKLLLKSGVYAVEEYDKFSSLLNMARKKYKNNLIVKRVKLRIS